MADDDKRKGFWQTLPGMLTGVAAVLTAIAGLIAGLGQIGIIKPPKPEKPTPMEPAPESTGPPTANGAGAVNAEADPPTKSTAEERPSATQADGAQINLLSKYNGGKVLYATSQDWARTIGVNGRGVVVGGHYPEEAIFSFSDRRSATFDRLRVLVGRATMSNVRDLELFVSDELEPTTFRSIGKFWVRNFIPVGDDYQSFRFAPTTARFLKVRLLTNQSGHKNSFEIYELQLFGVLDKSAQ